MNHFTNKVLLLPLLGFLVAGCSTSSNLQTSETDDVYFSSKDKVTYVEPTYEQRSEDAGQYQSSSEDITERVSDPETYQDDRRSRRSDDPYQYSYYDAPFGNPYYAYSPYYSPARYYSRAAMYDPWYDPFYDPFYRPVVMYDPFWPRPMYSGVMISIGLGWRNPWGYGYGYNPYRYGYGYNSYRYGGYYDGYYRGDVYARKVNYGPRHDRASSVGVGSASRTGSRDSRNSVSTSGTRNSRTAPDGVIRPSRSSDGTAYPTRRRTDSNPDRVEGTQQNSNSRSTEGQSAPPARRRRDTPETASQGQSQPRVQPRTSYEPSRTSEPSRSTYEPSRSSSSSSSSGSSGSSSSGSSSGSSRRGRN
ncbi:hypothetical protein TH61_04500 [Rufibacter sp. DG15C]|uniref:hypothetical protein n=1 Tax=Rufibacter sp. DG15C TaxID=1379909 RepID=UPI00078DBB13|nr:hypothetical protein [Rufibacter sp. DG15C]AMM50586.1 hypothetical protein TH61_04500 [Rufibacter sp. DG15C]